MTKTPEEIMGMTKTELLNWASQFITLKEDK